MNRTNKNKKRNGNKKSFLSPANRIVGPRTVFRNGSIFPLTFRTKMTMTFESSISALATTDFMIKGNSFYQSGPNTSWTSPSFSTNIPSGLISLLSSNVAAGSPAPYNRYRIYHSYVRADHTPTTISALIPYTLSIFPSSNIDYTAMALATVNEQPFTKVKFNTSANTSGKCQSLTHNQTTMRQFGLRFPSQMEDIEYSGTITADPVSTWYWHIRFDGISATAISLYIKFFVEYDVEFFDLNSISSSSPSLVAPSTSSSSSTTIPEQCSCKCNPIKEGYIKV